MSEVRKLVNTIVKSHDRLRKLGVMRSQLFQADLGEWLAERIFKGVRSEKKNQKHYDLVIGPKRVQVKTHAKSSDNPNKCTPISYDEQANFDIFVIIIFSQDFYIKEVYKLSKEKVIAFINKKDQKLYWRHIKAFQVSNKRLSTIDEVRPFLLIHDEPVECFTHPFCLKTD